MGSPDGTVDNPLRYGPAAAHRRRAAERTGYHAGVSLTVVDPLRWAAIPYVCEEP